MEQEAEVAGGCPDYPEVKDTGSEGKAEMREERLKEAISPSNFLVSALHYKKREEPNNVQGQVLGPAPREE